MKRLRKLRSIILLLSFAVAIFTANGIGMIKASAISVPSCSSFISNTEHQKYIDLMMNFYLNSNSNLQTALDNGKCVVFMFEGGSDNYPGNGYAISPTNIRNQAAVIVIKKNTNGSIGIAFSCEECSSIPGNPTLTTGEYANGATTLLDGIYPISTVNHLGMYGALWVNSNRGYYTPSSNRDGWENGATGINVHTRSSSKAGGTDWGWQWSEGCLLIGTGAYSSNTFNAFMKTVAGISYNVWTYYESSSSSNNNLATITPGSNVGYIVVDRQLGYQGLLNNYTATALDRITVFSRTAYTQAATAYLDVNGFLDGQAVGNIGGFGTADVYINGSCVANDCSDYYTEHSIGSSYEITDIRPASGYSYDGIYSGSRTGSIASGGANVVLQFSTIRLSDVTATPEIGFYGGHTYYYYATPVTVYTAKAFCESKGGHLVSLSDNSEDGYVKTLFPTGASVWIGATDEGTEGTWKWNYGTALQYSNWNDGEPNNSHGDVADGENFAHYTSNGFWNDTNGCQKYGFVCEIDHCEHNLIHYDAVAPGCETEGVREHWMCSECARFFADASAGAELTESEIIRAATGHHFDSGICTVCGAIDQTLPKGDINLDGQITSADTVMLARYLIDLAELNKAQLTAADMNSDGVITSADIVLLAQLLLE